MNDNNTAFRRSSRSIGSTMWTRSGSRTKRWSGTSRWWSRFFQHCVVTATTSTWRAFMPWVNGTISTSAGNCPSSPSRRNSRSLQPHFPAKRQPSPWRQPGLLRYLTTSILTLRYGRKSDWSSSCTRVRCATRRLIISGRACALARPRSPTNQTGLLSSVKHANRLPFQSLQYFLHCSDIRRWRRRQIVLADDVD